MSNKSRRIGSKSAQAVLGAAVHKKMELVDNGMGRPCSGYDKREAEKLLASANSPLTNIEIEGVGAGGELMLNMPIEAGDHMGMQLRDTVKDPSMVTASAEIDRLSLVNQAGALDLALDVADTMQTQNSLDKMLAHQLAALHVHAMNQFSIASYWQERAIQREYKDLAGCQLASIEAARASNSAAKMVQVFQQGLLTHQRIRSGGKQQVTVIHQHVQVSDGGQAAVTGVFTKGGGKHVGD